MTLYEISLEQLAALHPRQEPVFWEIAEQSETLIAAMVDDKPTCFVGLIKIVGGCYIWMETLADTVDNRIATARHAKELIRRALQKYGKVVGHCNKETSIRWMQSLGATIYRGDVATYFEIVQ